MKEGGLGRKLASRSVLNYVGKLYGAGVVHILGTLYHGCFYLLHGEFEA